MISVVVSTLDRPAHLERCLAGLAAQEGAGEFEVVVADDGSGPPTIDLIRAWKERAAFPLVHAWEENRGFRLARARNRGIRASRGEYLVFLDGDCVPSGGFLRAHREGRRPGAFLAGSRISLDRESTEGLPPGPLLSGEILRRIPRRDRARALSRLFLDRLERLLGLKDRPKPLGANLSAWRRDLESANGFDERYVGWGCEDEDLGRRLERLSLRKRFAPAAARLVHLWHPPDPTFRGRAAWSDNAPRLRRGIFLARCRSGLAPRPLREVSARIRGVPALEGAFPQPSDGGRAPELEILGPREEGWSGGSDVRIRVLPAGFPGRRLRGAQAAIEVGGDLSSPETARTVLEKLEEWL